MTTGSGTNKNKLKILVKGRLNRDVLRTLAHEWSHEHQRTILKRKKGKDIGGKNEDEASAQASQEMKKFEKINNSNFETHLITVIVYFHNIFLNLIHPFADGNGRVCRIIMGAIMMQKNCPPIFPQIMDQKKQIEYISTIIKCEQEKSDKPLIEYLAKGMTKYLLSRI